MGELRGSYKGYDLWFYEKGEKTSKAVWVAVSKGKRPEITELMKTKKSLKKLINETINKPPTHIEVYKETEIWYNSKTSKYEAKIGNRTKKLDDIEKIRQWIDKRKK